VPLYWCYIGVGSFDVGVRVFAVDVTVFAVDVRVFAVGVGYLLLLLGYLLMLLMFGFAVAVTVGVGVFEAVGVVVSDPLQSTCGLRVLPR